MLCHEYSSNVPVVALILVVPHIIFEAVLDRCLKSSTTLADSTEEEQLAMAITILAPDGTEYSLGGHPPSTTVLQLKWMLAERSPLSVQRQQLYLLSDARDEENDLQLSDNDTLQTVRQYEKGQVEVGVKAGALPARRCASVAPRGSLRSSLPCDRPDRPR